MSTSSFASSFWVETSVTAFLSLWNGTLSAVLLYKVSGDRSGSECGERPVSWKVLAPALLNLTGWSLCFLWATIARLDAELRWSCPQWAVLALWGCYSVLYSVSFVASYLFVVAMLSSAFSGSKFTISRCSLCASLTVSGVLLLLNVASLCFLYVLSDAVELDGLKLSEIVGAACYLLYIGGLTASYCVLNRNLIAMIMLNNDRSRIYLFNASQSQFLQTVTRLSVLISSFTVAVALYVAISFVDFAVGPNPASHAVLWVVYALTVVLGTLSIFLSFHFNEDEYRFFCSPCNWCCGICCQLFVKKAYLNKSVQGRIRELSVNSESKSKQRAKTNTQTAAGHDGQDHPEASNHSKAQHDRLPSVQQERRTQPVLIATLHIDDANHHSMTPYLMTEDMRTSSHSASSRPNLHDANSMTPSMSMQRAHDPDPHVFAPPMLAMGPPAKVSSHSTEGSNGSAKVHAFRSISGIQIDCGTVSKHTL